MEALRQRNRRFVDRRLRDGAEQPGHGQEAVTPESTLRTSLHAALQEFVENGRRRDRFKSAVKMLDAVRADWKKKAAENG